MPRPGSNGVSKTEWPKNPPKGEYAIAFELKTGAGLIRYCKVTIEEALMDEDDMVSVNLVDHPLYPQLAQYVKANRKGH